MRNILIPIVLICSLSCKKEQSTSAEENPQNGLPAGIIYYVDGNNGKDTNNGLTLTTPWKTIQKSFDAAVAGSTVMIRGGIYYEELAVHVNGTAGSPVTFTNYNKEQVVLDGSKISGTTILTISDKSYLVFSNLIVQHITKNDAMGVLLTASQNGKVTDVTFRNMTFKNINWSNNAAAIPTADNNAQPFIAFGHGVTQANAITNLVIDGCEFSNNITGYSEVLSIDGNVDGFTVTNNKVHDNTNIGIAALGHYKVSPTVQYDQARNGTISGNTCFNNLARYATSGGIYVDGGRDIKVDRNITYQNGYGIEVGHEENGVASNVVVSNNLIYLNQNAGVAVGGYDTKTSGEVKNCIIRNNSFFKNNTNNDGSGELYITKATNCTFGNNVFYTNAQNTLLSLVDIAPQAGNSFDYNDWYTQNKNADDITVNWGKKSFESFAAYRTNTKQEAHSVFKDPLYVSGSTPKPDLHVKAGSPALRTGNPAWITNATEKDFDGKPRKVNGLVDMGAYQQ